MADDGERIRVLMTEDSQIFNSDTQEEGSTREPSSGFIGGSNEGVVTFAAELSKALEDATDDSNLTKSESSFQQHADVSTTSTSSDEDNVVNELPQADCAPQNCGNSEYLQPLEDPYEKAWKYLSKHNILQLLQVYKRASAWLLGKLSLALGLGCRPVWCFSFMTFMALKAFWKEQLLMTIIIIIYTR